MKSKIIVGVVTIVLILVVAAGVMLGSLDSIIKTAIEEIGTETTKSQVQLDSANIQLTDAKGTLKGLSIANPAGFSGSKAVDIGMISLTLDPKNSTADKIVIKEIVINRPAIKYELGSSGNNFDAIKRNTQSGKAASKGNSTNSPRLIIENLYIKNGNIAVVSQLLGGKKLGATLPNIHLRNIGKKKGGATPEEVTTLIIASLTKNIGSAVSKLNLGDLKGLGSAIQKGATGTTDMVKEGIGGTTDKLKGLFK